MVGWRWDSEKATKITLIDPICSVFFKRELSRPALLSEINTESFREYGEDERASQHSLEMERLLWEVGRTLIAVGVSSLHNHDETPNLFLLYSNLLRLSQLQIPLCPEFFMLRIADTVRFNGEVAPGRIGSSPIWRTSAGETTH